MRGLDPRIHVFTFLTAKTWMAGSSPAMTIAILSAHKNFCSPSSRGTAKPRLEGQPHKNNNCSTLHFRSTLLTLMERDHARPF